MESNQHFQEITNSIPAAIAYIDCELKVIDFNNTYGYWFGLDQKSYTPVHVKEIIGQIAFEKILDYLNNALQGKHQSYQRISTDANGKSRTINIELSPNKNDEGKVIGFFAIAMDISDKISSDIKAQNVITLNADIHEISQQALTGINYLELALIAVNKISASLDADLCEIMHFKKDSDLMLIDACYGWERQFSSEKISRADLTQATGFDENYIEATESAGTSTFTLQGVLSGYSCPIYIKNTKYGVLGVHFKSDHILTNQEKNYIQTIVFLLSCALEREANETRLHEAIIHAETASSAKSSYLANMSHEIRTPMNGVIGMLELLKDTSMDAQQAEYVEVAHRSTENLMRIINNVLDLSKIEAGKLELEENQFNLFKAIRNTTDLFMGRAKQKDINLVCQLADNLPVNVIGDSTRIEQIITNLLSNAMKFTEFGEIKVFGKCEKIEDMLASIRFEVSDTGVGISDERKSKVFDSFTQEEASTTRKYGGTGLGLSIVKQLVELMGGEIGIKDNSPRGTCFYFTLNIKVEPRQQMSQENKQETVRRQNIMVVGEELFLGPIMGWIKNWGADIEVASSGLEAMSIIMDKQTSPNPISVIVCNHELPGMTSEQFFNLLDKNPVLNSIRRIDILPENDRRTSSSSSFDQNTSATGVINISLNESSIFDALANAPIATVNESAQKQHHGHLDDQETTNKILIAEDNPVNQKVTSDTLKKLGYEVTVANNGREAFEAFKSTNFDLILMDCQMPIMDGYEATQAIREHEIDSGKHTPIIAATAHAMRGDKEKCIEAGMDDYLSKPIRMMALKEKVEEWLSGEDKTQLL